MPFSRGNSVNGHLKIGTGIIFDSVGDGQLQVRLTTAVHNLLKFMLAVKSVDSAASTVPVAELTVSKSCHTGRPGILWPGQWFPAEK